MWLITYRKIMLQQLRLAFCTVHQLTKMVETSDLNPMELDELDRRVKQSKTNKM